MRDRLERLGGSIWLHKVARNTLWVLALLSTLSAAWAKAVGIDLVAVGLGAGAAVAGFVATLLNLRVGALSRGVRITPARKAAAIAVAAEARGGVVIAAHYNYPQGADLANDIREVFERAGWKVQGVGTRSGDSESKTGITLQRTRDGVAAPEFEALEAALGAAEIGFELGSEPASNIPRFHGSIYVGRPKR